MSGNIYHGSKIGVFTAGWIKEIGSSFKSAIEPFTAGWFTRTSSTEYTHHTQEIDYVIGEHTSKTKYSYDYRTFNPQANPLTKKCSVNYNGERELMQTLTQESITKFGIPMEFYYIGYDETRGDVDKIFGENEKRQVLNVWTDVMFWYKLQRENRLWSKFGIESSDTFSSWTPKAHFQNTTGGYFPQAGDIVREMIPNGRFFEVTSREEGDNEAVWFQSRQYMWEVKLSLLTVDSTIIVPEQYKNTELYKLINKTADVFDIAGDVEVKKEDVVYTPKAGENHPQSPFITW